MRVASAISVFRASICSLYSDSDAWIASLNASTCTESVSRLWHFNPACSFSSGNRVRLA